MTFFENYIAHFTVWQELEFFARILVACLCGAMIGLERSRRFKEAGIRTHILVACASALFMLISKYGFADLQVGTNGFFAGIDGADASRIASQVIPGISFLGAGVIFKLGSSVRGLTTAAGIWATSGIGLAVGAGMYYEGLFVTIAIMLLQYFMHKISIGKDAYESVTISATVLDSEQFRINFEELMNKKRGSVTYSGITKNDNGSVTLLLNIMLYKSDAESVSELICLADGDENVLSFEALPSI